MSLHAHTHSLGAAGAISRRTVLRHTAIAAGAIAASGLGAGSLLATETKAAQARAVRQEAAALTPLEPLSAILSAMTRYPLVGLADRHQLQEEHDFIGALLHHPDLPTRINDIVVEFGSAAYQDLADRFALAGEPVASAELAMIWRQIGDPTWNAPVYEQFFRTVRAVNWALPPKRRLRVLLGQPPVTMSQVLAHPGNRAVAAAFIAPMGAHFADVVEREVLGKGRRALLIAGGGHLRRGLHADSYNANPLSGPVNVATLLTRRHPGSLFVVDTLIMQVLGDPGGDGSAAEEQRIQANVAHWPRSALAMLADTWLGTRTGPTLSYRVINAAAKRYDVQADAVLYLGPDAVLTASRAEPTIYQYGAYREQLNRLSPLVAPFIGPVDLAAEALRQAQAGPTYFAHR